MTIKPKRGGGSAKYRIDFALTLLTGNEMRYLTTRPLVDSDPTVTARWYPIRTWVRDDPLRFLPGHLRLRARHVLDGWRLFVRSPADAVVMHTFEIYWLYALLDWLLRRDTVIIDNPDGAKLPGRGRLRALAVKKTDLFVPWSNYSAAERQTNYPELAHRQVLVLHPGIDLAHWPMRNPPAPGAHFRLLFIGGDLVRKGADTLLDAFERFLSDTCELHIATQTSWLNDVPDLERRILSTSNVELHLDHSPGSKEIRHLYETCDALVLPTNGDVSSWVALEAMATGLPVIIAPHGGIPDIVRNEETGLLIPPKDPQALAAAVDRLRASSDLRQQLISRGRAHIESHFDAEKNTRHLLAEIKSIIDARRAASPLKTRSTLARGRD